MQKILITPDNMPEITFKFVKMDRETSEVFMQLSFGRNEDFKKLLLEYPQILKVIPLLIAKRTTDVIIINDTVQKYYYNFNSTGKNVLWDFI